MEKWQIIRQELVEELDLTRDISEGELRERIRESVCRYGKHHLLSMEEQELCEIRIYNSLRKLDVLQELLDQEDITEILINGPEHIFYERNGQLYPWEKGGLTAEKLADVVQQIVGSANRMVNEAQPIVDTRLKDGSRVNIVLSPIALDGAAISIRKFSVDPMTLDRLVEVHSLSKEMEEFLVLLVKAGYNIFVSGGTGSGKTTFLNALSEHIPAAQRVITIEDSAELQMRGVQNLVRLETRCDNGSGAREISIRDLIRTSLRMRPDRIVVGEVRGAESLDMLQSFNTGHDGSMCTGHANSSEDMLSRLETMVLMGMDLPLEAVRRQIASGIDILVHLGRLRDSSRRVLQISEVMGMKRGRIWLEPLYQFRETGEKGGVIYGEWEKQASLSHVEKILAEGYQEEYEAFCKKWQT